VPTFNRCRAGLALLSLLLLLSLALNWLLFQRGKAYYRELNATRLDPLGLSFFPGETKDLPPPAPGTTRVVLLGDSRAQSWPAPAGLTGFEFINRGIGAQTSTQVLGRFEAHVAPLRPDVVVLQVGINDLKTLPLFPQRRASIVADCQANIQQIVSRARGLGATVILTTIFPAGEVPLARRPFWSDDIDRGIRAVNDFIRSLEGEGVILLDGAAILADGPDYHADTLHLNAAGYRALNGALVPLLKNLEY
jgi:lysophospholipase L1-like esterase